MISGKGYSSLSYLANLPVDIIKIDTSFVQRIGSSKDHEAIIKTIIAMADNLGLEVVAEGVETDYAMLTFLWNTIAISCRAHFFSRPLDPDAARHLISNEIYPGEWFQR